MITVFGSINMDMIGSVGHLPVPGETVLGGDLLTAPGGKGANQALAARRAGAPVRMVGAVGEDAFAGPALALLDAAGIDLAHVRRLPRHTGVALILVDAQGENVIAVLPGANGEASAAALAGLDLGPADTLVLQLEVPFAEVRAAMAEARRRGARIVLSLAPFQPLGRQDLAAADVLVVNETECAALGGHLLGREMAPEEAAPALAAALGNTVVATLGAAGALAAGRDGVIRVPALPVEPIDTVGAGDTFVGALAAALDGGRPLADALAWAAVAGSLACTVRGAQPGMPEKAAIATALAGMHRG